MNSLANLFHSLTENNPSELPSNWLQGRTAYGGFSSALALKIAVDANKSDNRILRSAQVAFIGPITSNVKFMPEILRVGKSATYICVKGITDNSTVIMATFIFGNDRESQINHNYITAPSAFKPDTYSELPDTLLVPDFFKNFNVRIISDSLFFSGGPKPELIAWVKFKENQKIIDELALLLIADSLPPASTVCFKDIAPISSMDWSFKIVNAHISTEWLLLRSNSLISNHGYSFQEMQLWNDKGELMMIGTQNVAIFG